MTREDFVRLARACAGGNNRPPATCSATFVEPWGETKTVLVECEHSMRNPAAYEPHEWVLEAMQRAYDRGYGQCHLDRIREESKMLDRQREDMCPENTGRG